MEANMVLKRTGADVHGCRQKSLCPSVISVASIFGLVLFEVADVRAFTVSISKLLCPAR